VFYDFFKNGFPQKPIDKILPLSEDYQSKSSLIKPYLFIFCKQKIINENR